MQLPVLVVIAIGIVLGVMRATHPGFCSWHIERDGQVRWLSPSEAKRRALQEGPCYSIIFWGLTLLVWGLVVAWPTIAWSLRAVWVLAGWMPILATGIIIGLSIWGVLCAVRQGNQEEEEDVRKARALPPR